MTERRETKCSWPGCTASSTQPFADGWSSYSDAPGIYLGLPEDGWLCQLHKVKFEQLAATTLEGPPTDSKH
jgi:hypothetical protein